jgi:D-threo-aldose 1-dehydrogenase
MRKSRLTAGGPDVSVVCVGTSPLGSMPAIYGYEVDEERAIATVRRVLESDVRFLDTSNGYSDGDSERRIRKAFQAAGGVPQDFIVATKADPVRGGESFTGSRVHESFAESAARLGVERFGVYYLHDPERFDFDDLTRPGGAVAAMAELKAEGLVDAIGVAGGDIAAMYRYVDTGVFDVLLNHSRYTLLDQSASALIDHATRAGLSFVNAAPYASGMLAKAPAQRPYYQYKLPSTQIIQRTAELQALCATYDIPLPALALQFSTRDPRISSTVVGVSTPSRVDELLANDAVHIPAALWEDAWSLLEIDWREVPRADV